MSKAIRTEINGQEYTMTPMNPWEALEFAPKVAVAMAEVIGDNPVDTLKKLQSGNGQVIGLAILSQIKNADPAKFTALSVEAISLNKVGYRDAEKSNYQFLNDQHTFNKHFSEKPENMLSLCRWAIWEGCKDFISGSIGSSQEQDQDPESKSQKSGTETTS